MSDIQTIVMPKWGLAMQEGTLAAWHVAPGQEVSKGQEICDIETSKIANVFESPVTGPVRRLLTQPGETVPVGALLAVVAAGSVDDGAIDQFVTEFQARFAELVAAGVTEKGPEPAFVEVGGRRLRYLQMGEGDGTPIVFIHGFGGDLNNWLFNQEELSKGRRTYAFDLPGHGGSSKEVGDGDVGALTSILADAMLALGIAKAHLVGHSLGGAVCLDLAVNHPELAASITGIAPAGLGPEISMEYIDGFMTVGRARKLKPILEMLVHDPALVTSDMVEDVLKVKRMDGVEAALNKIVTACFAGGHQNLELESHLPELRCPLQVVWGKQDRILPCAHSEGLPENVVVTLLDGCGHLAHMEKAAEVNTLIAKIAAS